VTLVGEDEVTSARLWHPWLRMHRVLHVEAAHTMERGGVVGGQVEFRPIAMAPRSKSGVRADLANSL